jgi:chorismate mutase/prephenate dehydratase
MDGEMLENARREIDQINDKLTKLLIERMKQTDRVAEWKYANNQPVFVPEREKAILDRVCSQAGEEFADDIRAVFQAVFAASRARETRLIHGKEKQL